MRIGRITFGQPTEMEKVLGESVTNARLAQFQEREEWMALVESLREELAEVVAERDALAAWRENVTASLVAAKVGGTSGA